jgi:hypothetical protein
MVQAKMAMYQNPCRKNWGAYSYKRKLAGAIITLTVMPKSRKADKYRLMGSVILVGL